LFNQPVPGVYEFLGLSIVAVVFLQMANTLRENRHVANDIILQWVGQTYPRVSRFFYGVFYLIGAALMALIVWFVWPNFLDNYYNGFFRGTAGYVEIPIWPFMLTVIVGGAATAIQYLLLAVQEFAKLPRGAAR
jgi:TRAP-type mannitol/chloroaromatic compound transport system permease small subunit